MYVLLHRKYNFLIIKTSKLIMFMEITIYCDILTKQVTGINVIRPVLQGVLVSTFLLKT